MEAIKDSLEAAEEKDNMGSNRDEDDFLGELEREKQLPRGF